MTALKKETVNKLPKHSSQQSRKHKKHTIQSESNDMTSVNRRCKSDVREALWYTDVTVKLMILFIGRNVLRSSGKCKLTIVYADTLTDTDGEV